MQHTKEFNSYESMTSFIGQHLEYVQAIDYDNKTVVIWMYGESD